MKVLLDRHRRVAAETAWIFAGQGASAIAALVGLRIITEMVPPAVYGAVALALGVVALAHGLAAGPLMQAVLRFYPELARVGEQGDLRRTALMTLRKPGFVTLGALALAGLAWTLQWPHDAPFVALVLALFIAEVARSVEITFLNAARRQRAMSLFIATDAWLRPLAVVLLVLVFGATAAAVLAGYLMGCVFTLAGFRVATKLGERGVPRPISVLRDRPDLSHRLWKYALPLTALPLIGWISGQADRFLVGGMSGVAAAGLYAALYGLASRPFLMFSASVELALRQPYYARVSAGDQAAERRALALWLAVVSTVSLALVLIFVLFHAEIAAVLLAAEYRSHSALMGWIASGYVLLAIAQVFERVCYAYHDTRGVLWVQASGATLSVLIAVPLIYYHGIDGAAWAVPVYFGAHLLLAAGRARSAWRRRQKHAAAAAVAPDPTTIL